MARINLEILLYLIWIKLLVWTRCPQRAGRAPPAAQMGKEWSADLSPWPRWAHEPLVCELCSFPFIQRIKSVSLLLLGLDFILRGSTLEENPEVLSLSFFVPFPAICVTLCICIVNGPKDPLNKDLKVIRDDLLWLNIEVVFLVYDSIWTILWRIEGHNQASASLLWSKDPNVHCWRLWNLQWGELTYGVAKACQGLWFPLVKSRDRHKWLQHLSLLL